MFDYGNFQLDRKVEEISYQRKQRKQATRIYCTARGIWPVFYDYKWSITFKTHSEMSPTL